MGIREYLSANEPQLQLGGKDDGINYGARKCKVWMKSIRRKKNHNPEQEIRSQRKKVMGRRLDSEEAERGRERLHTETYAVLTVESQLPSWFILSTVP